MTEETFALIVLSFAVIGFLYTVSIPFRLINKLLRKKKKISKPTTYEAPKIKRSTMKQIRKKISKPKFRPDGTYYDEKQGKWVGEPDFKN